jgi:predicted DNA-binding protein (MmcQ/YjbR family)
MPRKKLPSDAAVLALREFGLAFPGAHTKSPWPGHMDLAVRDKTFAYLSVPGEPFLLSCKLPHSNFTALTLPFAQPTAWGLGKSGWVSASLKEKQLPPIELFKSWIDESYRAQAPKKFIAQLDAGATAVAHAPSAKPSAPKKKASAARKAPAKRAASRTSAKRSARAKNSKRGGRARKASS